MKQRPTRQLNLEIDKLTNSIENSLTGELFNTEITRLRKEDLKSIKKPEWVFNWKLELLTLTM